MHSIDVLRDVTSEEKHEQQELCLVEQRWAPVLARPLAANAPQRSVQEQVRQALISTRASVITDVTKSAI
jgi:hypothetical protein